MRYEKQKISIGGNWNNERWINKVLQESRTLSGVGSRNACLEWSGNILDPLTALSLLSCIHSFQPRFSLTAILLFPLENEFASFIANERAT